MGVIARFHDVLTWETEEGSLYRVITEKCWHPGTANWPWAEYHVSKTNNHNTGLFSCLPVSEREWRCNASRPYYRLVLEGSITNGCCFRLFNVTEILTHYGVASMQVYPTSHAQDSQTSPGPTYKKLLETLEG